MQHEEIKQSDRGIDQLIAHNKPAIIAAMKAVGVVSAEVTYSGCGDSGNGYEVTFSPASPEAGSHSLEVQSIHDSFDQEKREWHEFLVPKSSTLETALRDFCESLIDATGHNGYQDGDGGGGTMVLNAETGCCELDHYDYIVDTVHHVTEH